MEPEQPILWRGLTILLGRVEIAKYMRCHKDTISAWIKHRGFPAAPLPNGKLATTVTLLDQWLKARADVYHQRLNAEVDDEAGAVERPTGEEAAEVEKDSGAND